MNIIKEIARIKGISESAVLKILSDPFGFSGNTAAEVRSLYRQYKNSDIPEDGIGIGVIIPNRPVYFWKEAVRGINARCRELCQSGIKVRLKYSYCVSSGDAAEACGTDCAAYIVYPSHVGLPDAPVVMLNGVIKEALCDTAVYVGADGYSEGAMAAGILSGNKSIRSIVAVRPENAGESVTNRLRGFTDAALRDCPERKISIIEQGLSDTAAASFLAKKLSRCGSLPDCIYVCTGKTNVAGAAIVKLAATAEKPMYCIGHERSDADRRYLEQGIELGYVAQNAYAQGYAAMEQIAVYITGGKMKNILIPSEVYMGEEKR